MIFDPGMIPTGRPSRIARFLALEPITDRQERINSVLAHNRPAPVVRQPSTEVREIRPKPALMYDDSKTRLPENVIVQLVKLVQHVNRPGSVPYPEVGAAADAVDDFFDLP